jgi:hypothetical protein
MTFCNQTDNLAHLAIGLNRGEIGKKIHGRLG